MPVIYPPKLSELAANNLYIPSSIGGVYVPGDRVLASDGNGGTRWIDAQSTISTALISTVDGLVIGGGGITSGQLISTFNGLGTGGYISSTQLFSTVAGIGGGGGGGDVSSNDLFSTTTGILNYPNWTISSLFVADAISTNSLTIFGSTTMTSQGSTFLYGPVIASSIETSTLQTLNGVFMSSFEFLQPDATNSNYNIAIGVTNAPRVMSSIPKAATNAIAIGFNAASTLQGSTAIAIGKEAGQSNQAGSAIAIGEGAALSAQGVNSIAIGSGAGNLNQSSFSVAIGAGAGNAGQYDYSIALGQEAGNTNQNAYSIAIGANAGRNTQLTQSIAIGAAAALESQGINSIAVGAFAGQSNQGPYTVAIGYQAGNSNQINYAIAMGSSAGALSQGIAATAIGVSAGQDLQGSNAIAIGTNAAIINQGADAVAVGPFAGYSNQASSAVAVGKSAGSNGQADFSVAIGPLTGAEFQGLYSVAVGIAAGNSNQGAESIAMGNLAGYSNQASTSIAIGKEAGALAQQFGAIALGSLAGSSNQQVASIAIGVGAGNTQQGSNSVAIGSSAGSNLQGSNSIAIGYLAGFTNQHDNTIVLNATGAQLNTEDISRTYIAPIRQNDFAAETGYLLGYTATNEVCQTSNNTIVLSNGIVQIAQLEVDTISTAQATTSTLKFLDIESGTPQTLYVSNATLLLNGNSVASGGGGISDANLTSTVTGLGTAGYISSTQLTSTVSGLVIGGGGITSGQLLSTTTGLGTAGYISSSQLTSTTTGFQTTFRTNTISAGQITASSVTVLGQLVLPNLTLSTLTVSTITMPNINVSGNTTRTISLGFNAGATAQGAGAIAMGNAAGSNAQGINAIAIGSNAGSNTQGDNSIAIGANAGTTNMSTQTIVINATGSVLNTAGSNRTYVAPVRQNDFTSETGFVLGYTTTNEICRTSNNTISLSNGRVGINRVNPAALLDVFGTAILQTSTLFGGTNAGSPQVTQIGNPGVPNVSSRLTFGGDNSGWQFRIGQNNAGTITDIITVNDGGVNYNNVGINTTSPAYGLDVVSKRNQVARFRSTLGAGSQEINILADTNGIVMNFNTSNDALFLQGVGTGAASALAKDMFEFYAYPPPGSSARRVYQISTTADVRFNSNVGIGTWPTSTYQLELSLDRAAKPLTTTWATTSDRRIKENIVDANLEICYSNIRQMKLRRFNFISSFEEQVQVRDRNRLGVIAQEVQEIIPKMVELVPNYGFDDFHMVNTDQLNYAHFGATKKLMNIVEQQSSIVVAGLETQLAQITSLVQQQASTIQSLMEQVSSLRGNNV